MPVCPHCQHQFNDDQVWYSADGCNFPTERDYVGDNDFDCPSCGTRLFVGVEWTPSWIFVDEDGDELDVEWATK